MKRSIVQAINPRIVNPYAGVVKEKNGRTKHYITATYSGYTEGVETKIFNTGGLSDDLFTVFIKPDGGKPTKVNPTYLNGAAMLDLSGTSTTLIIYIPTGQMPTGMFLAVQDLTQVSLTGIETISDKAFKSAPLSSHDMSFSGVSVVGNEAFSGCLAPANLSFDGSLTSIGDKAFDFVDDGNMIFKFQSTTPPTLGTTPFPSEMDYIINVPAALIPIYKQEWSQYASYITAT